MLHITNGSAAASVIRAAGLSGTIVTWDDVLHEGPVPAALTLDELRPVRARFLADHGWTTFDAAERALAERDTALAGSVDEDEVVLWFEPDLYDQLQLLQILDWFAGQASAPARVTLIAPREYLGPMPPGRLASLFPARSPVTPAELDLARRAWAAFRSPHPTAVQEFLAGDLSALPFLAAALRRHLEEFPSARNGLSRSESQALEVLADGDRAVGDAFRLAHHEREDPVFLGDVVFASYLARLRGLVTFDDGTPVTPPAPDDRAYWRRRLHLTDLGRSVLAGDRDWLALGAPERWLGGVQLGGGRDTWRWDSARGELRQIG
jgi:hypothetical protein